MSWLNIPNAISIARLALVPVLLWLLLGQGDPLAAGFLFLFIGGTDWVDGYLARRLDQVTEVGKILDPLADRVAVAAAVIGGLIAGYIPPFFGWALIVREALVAIGSLYLATKGIRRLDVRLMGKTATFMLFGAIAGFLGSAGGLLPDLLRLLSWIGGLIGLTLYYIVGALYLGDARSALASVSTVSVEPEEKGESET